MPRSSLGTGVGATADHIRAHGAFIDPLTEEFGRVIVGQHRLLNRLLIALLVNGHVLLEGPPGVAKTLAVRALAGALQLTFKRVQFTPDLLPGDVVGTLVFDPRDTEFKVRRGPIFANIVLADEVNRAPAKVQSALLEAMQERQVTLGDTSHALGDPFMVLATQNPLEHEGTYPLPEAQMDRFLMQVVVDYPRVDDEIEILDRQLVRDIPATRPVVAWADVAAARDALHDVRMEPALRRYIVDVVRATRDATPEHPGASVKYGASPRAAVHLALACRAHAFVDRRAYVVPEDVKALASDVLRHRLSLTWEAEAAGVTVDRVIGDILASLQIP